VLHKSHGFVLPGAAPKNAVAERLLQAVPAEHAIVNWQLKTSVFENEPGARAGPRRGRSPRAGRHRRRDRTRNSLSVFSLTVYRRMFSVH
jgi:hypothetical protein